MKLKARPLDLDADKFIVVLNERRAREEGISPLDRVVVKKGKKQIVAVVDVSRRTIKEDEIGLFTDAVEVLGVKAGEEIDVFPAPWPKAVEYIKRKLQGEELKENEIFEIVNAAVRNMLSDVELAYFVAAVELNGTSFEEVAALTRAIVETGEKLELGKGPVLDKHCIGGIPGNRTTMLVVPIIASLGPYIPKTSSRAITSPAGTADTMEVLARVEFSVEEIREIVLQTHGCMVWGGATGLASADDVLIRVRRPLKMDPPSLLTASILAKKKAVGAEYVIIDVPIGPEAKVRDEEFYRLLKKLFTEIGGRLGMKIKVVHSPGTEPIGNGIGPVLEARDVLLALQGRGPRDLVEKSLWLAGELLEFVGITKPGTGKRIAEKVLRSGKAERKFREIVEAQEGDPEVRPEDLEPAKYFEDYIAEKDGRVTYISVRDIADIAHIAGAPFDKKAGIYLRKHVGDKVKKGEVLFTVYSSSKRKLKYALERVTQKTMVIQ